jgi:hypothetical protein
VGEATEAVGDGSGAEADGPHGDLVGVRGEQPMQLLSPAHIVQDGAQLGAEREGHHRAGFHRHRGEVVRRHVVEQFCRLAGAPQLRVEQASAARIAGSSGEAATTSRRTSSASAFRPCS